MTPIVVKEVFHTRSLAARGDRSEADLLRGVVPSKEELDQTRPGKGGSGTRRGLRQYAIGRPSTDVCRSSLFKFRQECVPSRKGRTPP